MARAGGSAVYEARYGFDRQTVKMLAIAMCAVVGAFFVSLPVAVANWVFCGGGGLFLLYRALRDRLAFRVDENGVTLGATPIHELTLVPWSQITAIALWTQQAPGTSMLWAGVIRKPRVDALGEIDTPGMSILAPHVPAHVVNSSRPVSGWRLDRERMIAVARRYAPDLQVKDFG